MIDGAAVASRISDVLVALHYYLVCSRLGSLRCVRARPSSPAVATAAPEAGLWLRTRSRSSPGQGKPPSCPMLGDTAAAVATRAPWLARRARLAADASGRTGAPRRTALPFQTRSN